MDLCVTFNWKFLAQHFLYFTLLGSLTRCGLPLCKMYTRAPTRACIFHPFFLLSPIAFRTANLRGRHVEGGREDDLGGTNKWQWQLNILAIKITWNPCNWLCSTFTCGAAKEFRMCLEKCWLHIHRILLAHLQQAELRKYAIAGYVPQITSFAVRNMCHKCLISCINAGECLHCVPAKFTRKIHLKTLEINSLFLSKLDNCRLTQIWDVHKLLKVSICFACQ